MNDSEVEMLATRLGHDMTTNEEYYRLHSSAVNLFKVGTLLKSILVVITDIIWLLKQII